MKRIASRPEPPAMEATLQELIAALLEMPEGDMPLCALCRLTARSVERALRTLFAEFVNDPPTRQRFRQARGVCAAHIPLLAELGDALGVAILYHDLVE
ncbi:MAG TPA: hypothetical protein VKU00_00865, partial [Chthonomonadaceae bacterium]|nr:hypothetical protein [Chthonomonadaceae bacterium]